MYGNDIIPKDTRTRINIIVFPKDCHFMDNSDNLVNKNTVIIKTKAKTKI